MERLDPRVRIVWVVGAVIQGAIVGGLLVGGAYSLVRFGDGIDVGSVALWAAAVLAALIVAFGAIVAWLRYGVWQFEVEGDSLYIERGVFTRVRTVVPFVRVQHVDSQRGPLERAVGLATVVVYTAGSRSADVAIPGLPPDRAEDLREELRRLAIASETQDAV